MTDDEFAAGVDALLLTGVRGHATHRALDRWWARYALERGGPIAEATSKWMAYIADDHAGGRYPLGRRWWQVGPLRPKRTAYSNEDENGWGEWVCP